MFTLLNREGRGTPALGRALGQVVVFERLAGHEVRDRDGVLRQFERLAVIDLRAVPRLHQHRTLRDRHGRLVYVMLVVAFGSDEVPDSRGLAGVRQQETFHIRSVLAAGIHDFRILDAGCIDCDAMPFAVIHARIAEAAVRAALTVRAVIDFYYMGNEEERRRQLLADR